MFRSRDVILKQTYRLDAIHAGHTIQTTSTQTLLSPNALVLSPTTTSLAFIPPTNHPTCTHKTIHHYHRPQTPDWTFQSHNSVSSRHIKSFSTVNIDLLFCVVKTVATSHWLRSPLKAEADWNTVARKKENRLHSRSTRKKRRRTFFKLHTSLHQLKTPSEPPCITRACLGHVTSSSSKRIDVMQFILVTRIRQLPHKPSSLPTHSYFHQPQTHLHSSSAN